MCKRGSVHHSACVRVVKLDLNIYEAAITLFPKPANETPSSQGTHTGHSDQLLNETDQGSGAASPTALPIKQGVPVLQHST